MQVNIPKSRSRRYRSGAFPTLSRACTRALRSFPLRLACKESRFVAWDTEKWIFGNGCQSRSQIRDVFGATFGVPRAWRPALYIFQQGLSTCANSIFQEVKHRCDNNHNTCGPGVSLKYEHIHVCTDVQIRELGNLSSFLLLSQSIFVL